LIENRYYSYDLETYPNIFTCVIQNIQSGEKRVFEISSRKNDLNKLLQTLLWLNKNNKALVGYNNLNFDYPILQFIFSSNFQNLEKEKNAEEKITFEIYNYANKLIKENKNYIEDKKSIILNQVDLMKVHNFDYRATMVSLKMLEINMRMENIEDLPFPPGTILQSKGFDTLIAYNIHDVKATTKFFNHSKDAISFREKLSLEFNENMMNYSDTKIGKRYFIRNLEDKLGSNICYKDGRPRQTIRNYLDFSQIIFSYINFQTPQLKALLEYLKKQYTNDMSTVFSNIPKESLGELAEYIHINKNGKASSLHVFFDNFRVDIGTGGLHGSLESCFLQSDEEFEIIDVDVASYYPSIVVKNRLYPEHLGEEFADIYDEIRKLRFSYDKSMPQNKMLKLALNSAGYGDTNNKFSPFYDYKMTITITLNGQLMLCLLSEMLKLKIDSILLIQANTDGLTLKVPRKEKELFFSILKEWENITGMVLEESFYEKIWIRDVNNYIALKKDGGVKKIGAYKDNLEWHQNHSSLVVQKAVEAYLIKNIPIEESILNHKDPFDFMLNYKATRGIKLVLEENTKTKKEYISLQNTIRYYISTNGKALKKTLPPLKNDKEERIIGVNVGFLVSICNDSKDFDFKNLNYDWYIKEAYKLISPFKEKAPSNLFDYLD